MNQNQTESKPQDVKEPREEGLDVTICTASSDTPETDTAAFTVEHRGINNGWNTEQVYASHARKLERQRDEAIEIAQKAMETVMQIYGHAQFCDECQSFEMADNCRIQMHGMERINSLENSQDHARQ